MENFQTHHKSSKKKGDATGGKARGKGKGGHSHTITYLELRKMVDFDSYWAGLEEELHAMREHLARQLTLRSSTSLDDLPVTLEGDEFPLREVASLSKRDPKRIVIDSSSFPQATKSIVEAIRDSGMNLNPQQDGTR